METGPITAEKAKILILVQAALRGAYVEEAISIHQESLLYLVLDGCIFRQYLSFSEITIENDVSLVRIIVREDVDFTALAAGGSVDLTGARIEGYLSFNEGTRGRVNIGRDLILEGVKVKSLHLLKIIIGGNLVLRGASMEEIDLRGAEIGGLLDFSGMEGLVRIFVSDNNMAQLVHWAAPQASIIIDSTLEPLA